MRLLVLTALLATARALHGQDASWTLLASRDREPDIRADFGSARVSADDVLDIWIRMDFESDSTSEILEDDGSRQTIQYREERARFIVDCRHRQYNILQATSYDARGSVVRSFTPDTAGLKSQWHQPVPESLSERVVRGVCDRDMRTPPPASAPLP